MLKKLMSVLLLVVLFCSSISIGAFAKQDKVMDDSGNCWMSCVSGDKLLTDINIPGTHDSGTKKMTTRGIREHWAVCQDETIPVQLKMGTRILDIRLCIDDDQLVFAHGSFLCQHNGTTLKFKDVMNEMKEFLKQNPTETILISIKRERDGSEQDKIEFDKQLSKIISDSKESKLMYTENKIPKLDEVRGKIVLIRRFSGTKVNGIDLDNIGIDFRTNYKDNKNFEMDAAGIKFQVEDQYTKFQYGKRSTIKNILNRSHSLRDNSGKGAFIFTSTALPSPRASAEKMTDMLKGYDFKLGTAYGWIMVDFIESATAEAIYRSNFEGKYISDLYASSHKNSSKAKEALREKGYRALDGDFNHDTGRNYIHLGYKTTMDPNKAITGIVGEWYEDKNDSTNINHKNINYKTVAGEYMFSKTNAFDFNDTAGAIHGSGVKYIYMYYTKDKKAGSPITDLKVVYNNKSYNNWSVVRNYKEGDPTEFTKGTNGKTDVYAFYNRQK